MVLLLAGLELALGLYHAAAIRAHVARLPPVSEWALIPSDDPALGVEFNPGFSKPGFRVNSYGMADDPVRVEKPVDAIRIALFGDSVSANLNLVDRERAFPALLESLLAEAIGQRVEVLNFGVNGYSILQSRHLAELRVPVFDPDVILIQLCLNDPYPSALAHEVAAPSYPLRLMDFVMRRLDADRFWARDQADGRYDARGWENVAAGLRGFADLADGRPVLAVLFPFLDPLAYSDWGYAELHAGYASRARAAGIHFLDLRESFEAAGKLHPAFGIDRIHPNAEAHALATQSIASALVPISTAAIATRRTSN